MDSIFNKIDEIRKKPDYIRLRWAWGLTGFAMIFVLVIWVISFSAQIKSDNEEELITNENFGIMQGLDQQKESLGETTNNQMKNILGDQVDKN